LKIPSFEFIPIPAGTIPIIQVNLILNSNSVTYTLIITTKVYVSKPEVLRLKNQGQDHDISQNHRIYNI